MTDVKKGNCVDVEAELKKSSKKRAPKPTVKDVVSFLDESLSVLESLNKDGKDSSLRYAGHSIQEALAYLK